MDGKDAQCEIAQILFYQRLRPAQFAWVFPKMSDRPRSFTTRLVLRQMSPLGTREVEELSQNDASKWQK